MSIGDKADTDDDPPPDYYDSVDTTSAATLRDTVHEVIDDHTRFPYTSTARDTWDILEDADEDPNDSARILDLYKNSSYAKEGGGNSNYNREHTWPKSYGFPKDVVANYPFTDAHHLFLADSGYNSSRSNIPYRNCNSDCAEKVTDVNNGQGGGNGVFPGNSNWRTGEHETGTWQTWRGRKGDVARALFYLDVRYEGGTHGVTDHAEPDLILTDNAALIQADSNSNKMTAYMGDLSVLLLWHAEDPVDDLERNRNDSVFSDQGNRNPFIDHPEWAACVFQDDCPNAPPPGTEDCRNGTFSVSEDGTVCADRAYFSDSGGFNAGQGADLAEYIDASEPLEPGNLVELDPQAPGLYRKARGPSTEFAVGVVTSVPAITLANQPGAVGEDPRPLLALMGRVPVRATVENGPIRVGDLLVSSSTPGAVMRCDEPDSCRGTLVGKALEALEQGDGMIEMLLMR